LESGWLSFESISNGLSKTKLATAASSDGLKRLNNLNTGKLKFMYLSKDVIRLSTLFEIAY
jgi:hypothetical protein